MKLAKNLLRLGTESAFQVLAEAKIDQLTRDANNVIQSHISSTAIAATIAILQQKLNKQEQQKLIDKSIEELGSALKI